MADISQITVLDGTTYTLKDESARSLLSGKADDSNVVHLTGNETINGRKTFGDDIRITTSATNKKLYFKHNEESNGISCNINVNAGHSTNQSVNQMSFIEYSPKSTPDTDNTGFAERYFLPAPEAGLSSDANYDIYTSKNLKNESASSGGTDLSVVTTGEKYNWNGKADATDTELFTTLSRGRAANSTVGAYSVAFGEDVVASGRDAFAIGYQNEASGYGAFAAGSYSKASGRFSYAHGYVSEAAASYSTVIGKENVIDSYASWPEWVSGTSYAKGDKVKVTDGNTVTGYICKTANSDTTFTDSKWYVDEQMNFIEIVGNGTSTSSRSNAMAIDWDGNQYLNGDLYVGCNADSTGGDKVAIDSNVVHKSGPEDVGGSKTFTSHEMSIAGSSRYGYINFKTQAKELVGAIRYDHGNATNVTSGKYRIYQYSPKSTVTTTTTGHFEVYSLPSCAAGLDDDMSYEILTTKNPSDYLPLDIDFGTISGTGASVTTTKSVAGVIEDMRPVYVEFGSPANVVSSVDITPGTDSLSVTATILNGQSTTLRIVMQKVVAVTAT